MITGITFILKKKSVMTFLNNQRTTNLVILVLVVLNLFLLMAFWLTRRPPMPPPSGGPPLSEHPVERLQRDLGLSEQQVAAFRELQEQHLEQMRALDREMQKQRKSLVENAGADPEAAHRRADEIAQLARRRGEMLIDHFEAVQKVFTPAQFERFRRIFLETTSGGK